MESQRVTVEMLNTLRNSVQSDPTRIPAPAAMASARSERFADVLDETTAPQQRAPEATNAPEHDLDGAAPADGRPAAPAGAERRRRVAEHEAGDDAALDGADEPPVEPELDAVQDGELNDIGRGESGWRETAGKGTDSPRPSPAGAAERELALESLARRVRLGGPIGAPVAAQPAAAGAAAATSRAGADAPVRAVAQPAASAAGAASRAAATTAGYRTNGAVSAQLLDQARDSVFKQILFKISGENGEMRMRLEPPDLGELDLRMIVEDGNKLSLAIAAERPELAALIQRHVDELARTLQGSGLELVRADIGPRQDGAGTGAFDRDGRSRGGERRDDDAAGDFAALRRGGYVRADGLDYWV
ncbi:MAG: flagellar hook-length control protein FliK [Planctomycetota bacterium]